VLNFTAFTIFSTSYRLPRVHDGVHRDAGGPLPALTRTRIGMIIQALCRIPIWWALGPVPRVFMLVFGGGCALAGLAGGSRYAF
jgi:hypothetical protein